MNDFLFGVIDLEIVALFVIAGVYFFLAILSGVTRLLRWQRETQGPLWRWRQGRK